MSKKASQLLFILLSLFIPYQIHAQNVATFTIQPDSKLWIDGTSNKNDWTVAATEISGYVMMDADGTAANPGIEETRVVVPSAKIESNRSSIMDRLMHKALKVQQHEEITYTLENAEISSSNDDAFTIDTVGTLTLAGVTNEIAMPVEGETQSDGRFRFQGSYTMLMSDFEIDRPVAMYGALRTGDEVTVHFDLYVSRNAEQE